MMKTTIQTLVMLTMLVPSMIEVVQWLRIRSSTRIVAMMLTRMVLRSLTTITLVVADSIADDDGAAGNRDNDVGARAEDS